jgi:hypothetical protein
MRWWYVFLFLVPVVNRGVWMVICDELAARFDKDIGHSMGLNCLFCVFFLLLGFGSAEYEGTRTRERPVEDEEPRRRRVRGGGRASKGERFGILLAPRGGGRSN